MSRPDNSHVSPLTPGDLDPGSNVARGTLWNLLGTGLPILLALVTFPVLIGAIGTARFGVLTLAWVVLGYFGLFDLGLGRATTKFLAEAFGRNRVEEARALLWTSLGLNCLLGVVGGITLAALSPLLVKQTLNIDTVLQPEALRAFYLLALSVPIVTLATAARGVLEAKQSFGLLNALQVPASTLTFLMPLAVLPFSNNLVWLIGALIVSRLIGAAAFLVASLWIVQSPFAGPFLARKKLGRLFSYGGWLTVTNVVGPLMVYADRFVIGSLSSMSAVAYYATPYEAITRLWILPQSLTRTIFPIFAAGTDRRRRASIYNNALKYLALLLAPIVVTVVVFAPDLLRLWIGEEFAQRSSLVLQILAVGVLINSLALIPYTLIQGLGRPDITAKFHLLEAPFYLLMLWYGVRHFGIVGAATTWTIRVSADGMLLTFYVRLSGWLGTSNENVRLPQSLALVAGLVCCGWLLSTLSDGAGIKLIAWTLLFIGASYGTWRGLLLQHERQRFQRIIAESPARLVRIFSKNSQQGRP